MQWVYDGGRKNNNNNNLKKVFSLRSIKQHVTTLKKKV